MKILPRAVLALALCLAALPSFAQATPPARTEAAALLEQIDLESLLDQSIAVSLDTQIKAQPTLAPYRETMLAFFHKYMSYDAIKPELIAIYEEAFTEEELGDLRAFYQSPVGKKALKVMPSLMAKGGEIGQRKVEEHMPELKQMIEEQMAKEAAASRKP